MTTSTRQLFLGLILGATSFSGIIFFSNKHEKSESENNPKFDPKILEGSSLGSKFKGDSIEELTNAMEEISYKSIKSSTRHNAINLRKGEFESNAEFEARRNQASKIKEQEEEQLIRWKKIN